MDMLNLRIFEKKFRTLVCLKFYLCVGIGLSGLISAGLPCLCVISKKCNLQWIYLSRHL